MKYLARILAFATLAVPALALADSTVTGGVDSNGTSFLGLCFGNCPSYSGVPGLLGYFINVINDVLVPLIFAVAFIVFLWGVFKYFILGATDEESRSNGGKLVLYGIIGFAVMLSVWGLVNIVSNTFGLTSFYHPPTPQL
jgi:hypothetical protein